MQMAGSGGRHAGAGGDRAPTPARSDRIVSVTAVAALAVFLILVGIRGVRVPPSASSDTLNVVAGARAAAECVGEGTWTACGRDPGSHLTTVGPFPLLQYIPSYALVKLGLSDEQVVHALERLSTVAFLGGAALAMAVARRAFRPGWAPLLTAIFVTGYWLPYAFSGFGESLAAGVVVAFVAVMLLKPRPWLIAASLALACLGKETFLPFLILIGLVCGRREHDGWFPPRSVVVGLGAGGLAGFALTAAFNQFRFGEFTNVGYGIPVVRVSDLATKLKYAGGLWLAPNAGIVWFWLSFAFLLAVFAIATIHQMRRGGSILAWAPSVAVVLVLVGQTAGHASWYAPFGWQAWGPRLSLPLAPAVALTAVYTGGTYLDHLMRGVLRHRWRAWAVAAVLGVVAWPQVGVVWKPAAAAAVAALDEPCPEPASVGGDRDYYYRCINNAAWRRSHMPLGEALGAGVPAERAAQAAILASTILLVEVARREMRQQGDRRADGTGPQEVSDPASALTV